MPGVRGHRCCREGRFRAGSGLEQSVCVSLYVCVRKELMHFTRTLCVVSGFAWMFCAVNVCGVILDQSEHMVGDFLEIWRNKQVILYVTDICVFSGIVDLHHSGCLPFVCGRRIWARRPCVKYLWLSKGDKDRRAGSGSYNNRDEKWRNRKTPIW